jgi:hypothetical protein
MFYSNLRHLILIFSQALTTVVQDLDRALFEGYIKPKASVAIGILRGGILDTNMDWYETPQPTGKFQFHGWWREYLTEWNLTRNTAVHVWSTHVSCWYTCPGYKCSRAITGPNLECACQWTCRGGPTLFSASQAFWDGRHASCTSISISATTYL